MINLNITKIQIEYLLFIKNYEGRLLRKQAYSLIVLALTQKKF